jgi:hypothetical protein
MMKENMQGVGVGVIDYILNSERLDYKTNLLARVNNVDELQEGMEHTVYSTILNPLFSGSELQADPIVADEDKRGAVYG